MSGLGYISVEKDRRCSVCEQMKECRPYGFDGADICFECSQSTEALRIEQVKQASKYLFGETVSDKRAKIIADSMHRKYNKERK